MKKYICLRDDDTSFITTPEQLKLCYGEFWGNLPVTLATIPFLHGSSEKINEFGYEVPTRIKVARMREWQKNATVDEIKKFHTFQPVGDNEELVNELKRMIALGKVEIAQHGVFHRYNEKGADMQKSQMSFEWVRDGKEYLEKVFDVEIRTFIPPSNTMDPHCLNYLKRLNLNLFTSGSLRHSSKTKLLLSYISDPLSMIEKAKEIISKSQKPIYRRCNAHIFNSITYDAFKSQDLILEKLNQNLERYGFAALGTHYQLLLTMEEYRKLYHDLLRKLLKENVEFVTAKDYHDLLMSKFYE